MSDRLIFPPDYFPDFNNGRPLANAYIYAGLPKTDPEIESNRINLFIKDEQAEIVAIEQPVRTSAGGVPIYDGSPAYLVARETYSLKVLDSELNQVYYFPEIIVVEGTEPVEVLGLLTSNLYPVYTNDSKRVVLRG